MSNYILSYEVGLAIDIIPKKGGNCSFYLQTPENKGFSNKKGVSTWHYHNITVDKENEIYDNRDNCNAIIETSTNKLLVGCNKTTIPASVTSIEESAFYGCSSLNSINIPASVTEIGDDAFGGCGSLNSIIVDEGNKIYDSRNNCNAIIEKNTDVLIRGCNKTVIPSDVVSIDRHAFTDCNSLSSIKIPASVISIGDAAFSGCSSLSSIEIPDNVTSIGFGVFYNCSSLSSIKIPLNVISIEDYAFSGCSSLGSIKIPASVTSIENYVFEGCSSLSNIEIPASVTSIENTAFSDCPVTMTVWTERDSYAVEWASKHGYQVKYIGEDSPSDDENKENSEPSSEENNDNPETPTTQENNNQTTEATPAETPTTKPSTTTQSTNPSAITPASKGSVLQADTLKCKVKVLSEDINNPTVEYTGTTNKKSTIIKVPDTVTVDGVTYKVTKVADSALSGNK